jgi:coupling of ubiquitin conjugation to ER degradation protein 1
MQPPPAYYTLFPRDINTSTSSSQYTNNANNPARPAPGARPAASAKKSLPKESLIARYRLEDRVQSEEKVDVEGEGGGKAVWEQSAEKREASLRERKAKMILSARQCVFFFFPFRFFGLILMFCLFFGRRLLEQQKQQKGPELMSAKS